MNRFHLELSITILGYLQKVGYVGVGVVATLGWCRGEYMMAATSPADYMEGRGTQ